jgi:hypothetical protein
LTLVTLLHSAFHANGCDYNQAAKAQKKKKKKRKEKWGLSYHLGTTAPKIGEEGSSQSFNIISI